MSDQESNIQTPGETAQQPSEDTPSPAGPSAPVQAAPVQSAPVQAAGMQAAPLLMGVKLPVRVLLGRTELPLREIAQLGNGAVVELDCSPDDPVEIVVNDRVIAHGEVVVVSGNYGVRITKIPSDQGEPATASPASDLRSLSQNLR
jgi:flagellar motor switch protein FliN